MGPRKLWVLLVLAVACISVRASASATLFLEEPYSYDGTFAGTGHTAVYLSRICAASPIKLRRCEPGETGIVLSRYHGIAGYDWLAMPLIPYLYAVDSAEKVPLYADPKLEAFLRDRYRRKYLATVAPDLENGEPPEGPWIQLVGAAYDRTIYAFEIETSAEKDDELIAIFNARDNKGQYKLLSANCADFVRSVINFYYPGALHRSVIADFGVTTPKQIAKCLVHYSKRHPKLQFTNFVIPQVPGTVKRSSPVRGVVESAFKKKKYMVPLLVWHPAIVGCFAAAYFTGRGGFDPGRHALVFDPDRDLEPAMTAEQRREYQKQLEFISKGIVEDEAARGPGKWPKLDAEAEPQLDENGVPLLRLKVSESPVAVALSRKTIVAESESPEIAREILMVRLREELRRSAKTSNSDVDSDLQLLQELRTVRQTKNQPATGGDGLDETASKLR